jgi:hypothetical protein
VKKKETKFKNPVENLEKRVRFQLPSRFVCHFVSCYAFLQLKLREIAEILEWDWFDKLSIAQLEEFFLKIE